MADQISHKTNAERTVSSGYESEGNSLPTDQQKYSHGEDVTIPYHLLPPGTYNPVLLPGPQPLVMGTNAHPLPDQYYPVLPGQPCTAPIMLATKEQVDYALGQRLNTSPDQLQTPEYIHRQYSGPVMAMPINQLPTNAGYQLYGSNVPHRSSQISANAEIPKANTPLVGGNYKPPHLPSNAIPNHAKLIVTESLPNFQEKMGDGKPPRRNTLPQVDSPSHKRKEMYKKGLSMKEKSICEEEEDEPLFHIGEDFGGYDYQFLLSPDDLQDVTCPICQLVLCEPFLTTCCGMHFCNNCVTPLLHKRNPCPMCNNTNLQGIIDRRTERRINSLPVHCTKSSMGCTWTGSLNDLHNHLSPSTGTCAFVITLCPLGCREELPLSSMKRHQEEECPKRIHQCKFCDYKGVYGDMPNSHWPVCGGYPVACPHNCAVNDMPRRLLNQHLSECPKRTVQCCYGYVGCSTPLQGDEVRDHMESSVGVHLNMVSDMVKKLLSNWEHQQKAPPIINTKTDTERNTEIIILNRKLNEKEEEISSMKSQLAVLQDDNEEMRLDLARMKSVVHNPPFKFTLTKFSEFKQAPKQWFSSPFYTHDQGYKMCMSVDCNGADEGEGTHVSVYANLMRGEFDDNLTWPFFGTISVQLYNHSSDSGHIIHDIPFRKNVPEEIAGRVIDLELAESGLGVPQFVLHSKLRSDKHTNTEYLKDDMLKFCVLSVKIL